MTDAYFASFALAFGEGPAVDVLRIWADGKLIFDKTGANQRVSKNGLGFRFHRGTETELPDPLIESHVGAGQAPAHRGLCTIVFENLPLPDTLSVAVFQVSAVIGHGFPREVTLEVL